jgi:hypothetical protein
MSTTERTASCVAGGRSGWWLIGYESVVVMMDPEEDGGAKPVRASSRS